MRLYINNWGAEYPRTFINSNPDQGVQIHIVTPGDSALVGAKYSIYSAQSELISKPADL